MRNLLIYGINSVQEAILSGKNIDKIFIEEKKKNTSIKELIYLARKNNIPIQFLPQERFNSYANKNHQGVIARLSLIEYQNIEDIVTQVYENGDIPLILALDGITDVRNFGAIARSALAANVHAIVTENKGSALINDDAIKTSAGALLNIPVCREKSLIQTLKNLKLHGLNLYAATEKGDKNIFEASFINPLVIIVGNEEKGIRKEILNIVDAKYYIPMSGKIDSLNVSVATGIVLFEIFRQRSLKK